MQSSPSPSYGEPSHDKVFLHSDKKNTVESIETIEVEPRFNQIREDLASMFLVYIENEEMLMNKYVKDELYSRVDEDIRLLHHFALDYMANEKLYSDGDALLTQEDFTIRGIRTLQNYGTIILSQAKEPARSRIKELFVLTGMFTQQEADQLTESLRVLH